MPKGRTPEKMKELKDEQLLSAIYEMFPAYKQITKEALIKILWIPIGKKQLNEQLYKLMQKRSKFVAESLDCYFKDSRGVAKYFRETFAKRHLPILDEKQNRLATEIVLQFIDLDNKQLQVLIKQALEQEGLKTMQVTPRRLQDIIQQLKYVNQKNHPRISTPDHEPDLVDAPGCEFVPCSDIDSFAVYDQAYQSFV